MNTHKLLTYSLRPLALLLALPLCAGAAEVTSGVYLTHGDEAAIVRYETWAQQSMAPIIEFGPDDNWTAMTGTTPGYGLAWSVNQWVTAYRPRILWSLPMLPRSGASLAAGAAGSYDNYWRSTATTLINAGYANSTIRIGWEFNGSWFTWSTGGTGSNGVANTLNYLNYWKKIVLAMRSVPGANFKFNWCASVGDQYSGSQLVNPAASYPEPDTYGSYVDEIGIDVYDSNWTYYPIDPAWPQWQKDSNRTNAWNSMLSWGTYDLTWWASFAASKGKPLTIPEWGLAESVSQHGGGDNAIFMQKFHEWLITPANNVKWHAYFQDDVSFLSKIFEDNADIFPQATAKFLQLFTGRAVFTLFQNPINRIGWLSGYGTRTGTLVGTDGAHQPFEGANQYKVTYTSSAGFSFGFNQQNLTEATHLRLAVKGPLNNPGQYLGVRLVASDGTVGALSTISRSTAYKLVDIPISALSSGLTLSKVSGVYFYPLPSSPTGVSDVFYLDNVVFLKK